MQRISGDWEYQSDLECYETAYEIVKVTGHYSYGVGAVVTRNVMDAIAARQAMLIASGEPMDTITPDGNGFRVDYRDDVEPGWLVPDADDNFDLSPLGYTFYLLDEGTDNVIRTVESTLQPRVYCVGLPVVVTVNPDGSVEWEIDKSEAATSLHEGAPEADGDLLYTDEQIAADAAAIDADLERNQ